MTYDQMLAALVHYDPSRSWSLPETDENPYEGLVWHNESVPLPTEQQLNDAWAEIEPTMTEAAWSDIRSERDALLTASDWTQVADAPVDAAAWAVYRQALRDVPQDFDSPDDVVWPTAP